MYTVQRIKRGEHGRGEVHRVAVGAVQVGSDTGLTQ